MTSINKLSDAELERLAKLSEECSEVIKCVAKIIRHGYESYNPDNVYHKGNRIDLQYELIDVISVINMMTKAGDIQDVHHNSTPSGKYLHYQKELE